MAGVRISREKGLALRVGGAPSEIQEISPEFSFMVFDYNSYVKVVILGNLCGGALQDPPRRVSREISPSRPSLFGYPRFLLEIRKVYLNIPVFLEKDANFICVPSFSPSKLPTLSAYLCFS